jgi:hypothetical protein
MVLGDMIINVFFLPYIALACLIPICIASVILHIEMKKEVRNSGRIRDCSIVIVFFGLLFVVAGGRRVYNFFNPPLKQLLGKVA